MSISAWGYWEGWTGCAQRFDHGRACQSTADQNEIGIFHFKRTALHLSVEASVSLDQADHVIFLYVCKIFYPLEPLAERRVLLIGQSMLGEPERCDLARRKPAQPSAERCV